MDRWRNTMSRKELYLPLLNKDGTVFCTFDCESTGLADTDKIIQFSAAKFIFTGDEFREINYYDTFINPEIKLDDFIVQLTGITDKKLCDAPVESQLVDNILKYIAECDVWVGYNLNFDMNMLKAMAGRNRYIMPAKPVIDVMELARDFITTDIVPDRKLQNIAEYLLPGRYHFHDAMEDVRATIKVLECLVPELRAYDVTTGTEMCHLEKASIWNNPYKKEARIKLKLSEGEMGDIYYSVFDHYWACKKTTSAKRLFNRINMSDIENQFLNKYGFRYGHQTMEDVGYGWLHYKADQKRKKKTS